MAILRFRAWEKRHKSMEAIDDLYWFEENQVHDEGDADNSDYVIMQSTGIVDRNGNEVFEGDILAVRNWGGDLESLGRVAVVWDVDEKGWRYSPNLGIEDAYDQFRNVQVIGNVHENPELLTEGE